MCIFCERAKASLDDPLASIDVDAWSSRTIGGERIPSSDSSPLWKTTLQQKKEAERCEELRQRARLPVTVITGFLGAGKTTFVNHLLSARHGRRLAVIENEFGEVAIDDELLGDGGLERGEEAQQVILMPNGCMCCRVRGDLVAALKRIVTGAANAAMPDSNLAAEGRSMGSSEGAFESEPGDGRASGSLGASSGSGPRSSSLQKPLKLDGIILECSGLDELAPVLQTFFADSFVQGHLRLDAVVCLVDSPRLLRTMLARPGSVGVRPGEDVGAAKGCRREGTETGTGREGRRDGCGSDLVMNQLALSDRILLNKSDLISDAEGRTLLDGLRERFPSASVTRCVRGEVDVDLVIGVDGFSLERALEADRNFAAMFEDTAAAERMSYGEGNRGHSDEVDPLSGGSGTYSPGAEVPGHAHAHDRLGARSVGLELSKAPVDWLKFKLWMKDMLEKEGDRIWRMKGVLWTTTSGRDYHGTRTVVQGLYGHVESEAGEWPAGVAHRSRIVFIGDFSTVMRENLEAGVRSCVARPRAQQLAPGWRASASASAAQRPAPAPAPALSRAQAAAALPNYDSFARRLGAVKFGGEGEDVFL